MYINYGLKRSEIKLCLDFQVIFDTQSAFGLDVGTRLIRLRMR